MAHINSNTSRDRRYHASDIMEGPAELMSTRMSRLEFATKLRLSPAVVSLTVRIALWTHTDTGHQASDATAIAIFFATAVAKYPKSMVEVGAVIGIKESLLRSGYSDLKKSTGEARVALAPAVSGALGIGGVGALSKLEVSVLFKRGKKDTKKRKRVTEDV
ncbi:hypothetical protein FRB97_009564 [Tulasnella sp. 331]|nr:hypothetical protein FRB97_009564 [Tulasnella sp. 331]